MMDLKLVTQKVGQADVTTVLLNGIIDAYTYGEMAETFNRLIEQKNYKLIVDLSNVDYLTNAGAGVLISVYTIIQENNGNIVLVNPRPKVKEAFELLGLTKILPFTQDINSALKAFA